MASFKKYATTARALAIEVKIIFPTAVRPDAKGARTALPAVAVGTFHFVAAAAIC